jgi:hypothetical protein
MNASLVDSINFVGKSITFWMSSITIPFGIILNIFSIYVFWKPNLNKTTMGFFYLNISAWNTIVLFHYIFIYDPMLFFNYDIQILSDSSCVFYFITTRVLRQIPTWIEALITLDRYLCVCHHNKFKFMKNRWNIFLIIIAIIIFLVIVGIPNFLFHLDTQFIYYLNSSNITNKVVKCLANKEITLETNVSAVIFKIIIPGIAIILFSILLLEGVKNSKGNRTNLNKSTNKIKKSKEKELESSILWMNLIFLILNVPVAIMYSVKSIYENAISDQVVLTANIISNVYNFTTDVANLYYSLMFFTFLAFNKLFFKETLITLKLAMHLNRSSKRSTYVEK